ATFFKLHHGVARAVVTKVSGSISQNTVWSGTVVVTGYLRVEEGVTLKIKPGTKVKFAHNRDYTKQHATMEVYGRLVADGTASQQIFFTSDAAKGRNGDWEMLRLFGNTNSVIDHAVIEYAKQGLNL